MRQRLAGTVQGEALRLSHDAAAQSGGGPERAGNVVEIFSGIQGEGVHVGERHLFLRLAGCDFDCDYCDQPEARGIPGYASIEKSAGGRDFVKRGNPLSVQRAANFIRKLWADTRHRAVAVTGGEPLMQAGFLSSLLPILRRCGMKVLLETNGTRAEDLRALRGNVDVVSMDLKLRSATGRPFPRKRHARFLALAAREAGDVYVKAVVTSETTEREMRAAARLVRDAGKSIPFVIQPVTRTGRQRKGSRKGPAEAGQAAKTQRTVTADGRRVGPPSPDRLLRLEEAAARILDDVRVIPQTHKLMGQR
jgi:organic radical activating enzyme